MASNALNEIDEELKTTKDLLHFLNDIMSDLTDIQKKLSERRRLRGLKEEEDAKNNVCTRMSFKVTTGPSYLHQGAVASSSLDKLVHQSLLTPSNQLH
ncbi:hypothetical protein HOLleu_17657 [Holothuria leucospilota]|uniref:Uncharacterized protein n=1 Tax=Holothuria leucospilota TaxID=206669 RepID=A0A9Q1H8H2_HOLLE|nr:hypothetical protein HOLleu_17657 [Holothuria leucospilota]